ncbi:MAG TPA: mycofactocin-coupled SDR family oxidoreductase [Micromonosporaceae bacterium]|nr:mycofactocin-coupled SDR family oxidoreductase [Micromonosporaceae bacterium]
MPRLAGRVAIVTGGARGVGRAIAVALAGEGADVLVTDLCRDIDRCPYPMGTAEQLDETARRCRDRGARAVTAAADVRSPADARSAVRTALDELGRVDILVNNAGVVAPGGRPAHDFSEEEWLLVTDVNLHGPWRFAKAVLPHMVRRRSGSIVNIASTGGLVGFPAFAPYVAAKHGLVGLTRALAADYGPYGIRVNAVCPTSVRDDPALDSAMLGAVATALDSSVDAYQQLAVGYHPLGSLVDAEDVAAACVWLASDESRRVTGTAIPVDSGFTAK